MSTWLQLENIFQLGVVSRYTLVEGKARAEFNSIRNMTDECIDLDRGFLKWINYAIFFGNAGMGKNDLNKLILNVNTAIP